MGRFGIEKLNETIKSRIYWPGMIKYLESHVSSCNICARCKVGVTPKAPLIPIYEAQIPMEFLALDIAYMPTDTDGNKYVLFIGDIFSKYVEAIPMRDQTAPTIIQNMWKHWLCRYGYPKYILTDRGSNVDGEVVNTLCSQFGIEKRRTSGCHSQGNGFAEQNIRSIREILRTSLLEFKLPQILWRLLNVPRLQLYMEGNHLSH